MSKFKINIIYITVIAIATIVTATIVDKYQSNDVENFNSFKSVTHCSGNVFNKVLNASIHGDTLLSITGDSNSSVYLLTNEIPSNAPEIRKLNSRGYKVYIYEDKVIAINHLTKELIISIKGCTYEFNTKSVINDGRSLRKREPREIIKERRVINTI